MTRRPLPEAPIGATDSEPPRGRGAARLAVLGDPIAHSRSPQLHLAAYRTRDLDWEYSRWRVPAGGLAAALGGRGQGWRGVSVTAPLKAEALAFCLSASPDARRTGAANTIVFASLDPASPAYADNTDIAGIVGALADHGVDRLAGRVDVLGAGGTAASAVVAAERLGAPAVRILARRPEAAAALAERFADSPARITTGDLAEWRLDEGCALVIDTVPRGFDGAEAVDPALAARTPLFSAAYDPWPTPLAAVWQAAGGVVATGAEMLLHQAVVQVRLFLGHEAGAPLPNEAGAVAAMRAALAAD